MLGSQDYRRAMKVAGKRLWPGASKGLSKREGLTKVGSVAGVREGTSEYASTIWFET